MHLSEYLKEQGRSQAQFGASLRPPVSQALVSQWALGHTAVSLHYSIEIERETSGVVTVRDCAAMLQRQHKGRARQQGRSHA